MKISVIVPVFNEEASISAVLSELEMYMNEYEKPGEWEIVIVNDGSSDKTVDILNSIRESKEWLKVADLVFHHGRGRALREGFKEANGDIIVSIDADLSYAPYHIERLAEKIEKAGADIVLASAYRKGGSVKNVPLKRLWLSKLGNKILSYMFGGNISVLTCLVRAYRREFIEGLDLHSEDKEIHLEILYKARMIGAKIAEVPADLRWRDYKLLKSKTTKSRERRSTIKIRKTSSSHLFFALMSKPGLIFWIPGFLSMTLSLLILFSILTVTIADTLSGISFFFAVRKSMFFATASWLTMSFTFLLAIQFFTLGFLTNQNKSNHEETYKTLNAIFSELKKRD